MEWKWNLFFTSSYLLLNVLCICRYAVSCTAHVLHMINRGAVLMKLHLFLQRFAMLLKWQINNWLIVNIFIVYLNVLPLKQREINEVAIYRLSRCYFTGPTTGDEIQLNVAPKCATSSNHKSQWNHHNHQNESPQTTTCHTQRSVRTSCTLYKPVSYHTVMW